MSIMRENTRHKNRLERRQKRHITKRHKKKVIQKKRIENKTQIRNKTEDKERLEIQRRKRYDMNR